MVKPPRTIDTEEQAREWQSRAEEKAVQTAFFLGLRNRIGAVARRYNIDFDELQQESYEPMMNALRIWDRTKSPWGPHVYMYLRKAGLRKLRGDIAARHGVTRDRVKKVWLRGEELPPSILAFDLLVGPEQALAVPPPDIAGDIDAIVRLSARWRKEEKGRVPSPSGYMEVKPIVQGYIKHVILGEKTPAEYAKLLGVTRQAVHNKWHQFTEEIRATLSPPLPITKEVCEPSTP